LTYSHQAVPLLACGASSIGEGTILPVDGGSLTLNVGGTLRWDEIGRGCILVES